MCLGAGRGFNKSSNAMDKRSSSIYHNPRVSLLLVCLNVIFKNRIEGFLSEKSSNYKIPSATMNNDEICAPAVFVH